MWEAKQQLMPLSQRGGGQTETEERAKLIVKDKAESQILRCRRRGAENTQVCVGCWERSAEDSLVGAKKCIKQI